MWPAKTRTPLVNGPLQTLMPSKATSPYFSPPTGLPCSCALRSCPPRASASQHGCGLTPRLSVHPNHKYLLSTPYPQALVQALGTARTGGRRPRRRGAKGTRGQR